MTRPAPPDPGKSRLVPWLAVLALAVVQLQFLPGDYLGRELDDAYYFLAARGLAHGEFRLGVVPGNPPITFITPGFPLLLVPVAWLFGESHAAFHLAAWLFLAACDALAWLWLSRRLPRVEALVCVLLFGLSPLVLARAGTPMTEFPALALALAAFLAIEADWPAWSVGLIVAYAWLIRQGTVALVPAVCGWYAARRRWKDAAWSAAPFAAIAAAVTLWFSKRGAATPKLDEMASSYAGGWGEVPRAVFSNWSFYARLWGRLWLPAGPVPGIIEAAVGGALFFLCLLGGLRILKRKGWEPAVMWVFFGAAMHTFWPWRYERYLVSFLPVLIWMLWEGATVESGWKKAARVRVVFFLALLAGQVWSQDRLILRDMPRRSVPEIMGTYQWIRAHIPERAAIASLPYSRDALYTGRPATPLPRPAPPVELARTLRLGRVGYVLVQEPLDLGSSFEGRFGPARELERLKEALRRPPFRRIYANSAENTAIYEVPHN